MPANKTPTETNAVDQVSSYYLYRRLLSYALVYWGIFIVAIIGMVIVAGASAAFPALMQPMMDGGFVDRGENVLAFGLPGRGKTHLLAAIARELIFQKGHSVLFTSTHRLVEQLLRAKRELEIEKKLKKLDSFDVILLDDIGYVQQSREEMEVLFTFLSERYERRSLMITSNLLFSDWDKIFKDPMTTAAAIDRLVHHSTILELDNDSYRAKTANNRRNNKDKAS